MFKTFINLFFFTINKYNQLIIIFTILYFSLSPSLSLSHTHTHIYIQVYIVLNGSIVVQ